MNGGIRQLNSKIAKLENDKKKNDDIIETKTIRKRVDYGTIKGSKIN